MESGDLGFGKLLNSNALLGQSILIKVALIQFLLTLHVTVTLCSLLQ